jgi:hypothetical protein
MFVAGGVGATASFSEAGMTEEANRSLRPIRTEEEGNPFAKFGIDCGPGGEAKAYEGFGLGEGFAKPEDAVTAMVAKQPDADPTILGKAPLLIDAVTVPAFPGLLEERRYALTNGDGVAVYMVSVVHRAADGLWSVRRFVGCVYKPASTAEV